jgi:hypothetical protein
MSNRWRRGWSGLLRPGVLAVLVVAAGVSCLEPVDRQEPQPDQPKPPVTVGRHIGAPCTHDDQCGSGSCNTNDDAGWLGGYCWQRGCPLPGQPCGQYGVCVAGLAGSNLCLLICERGRGCRPGYRCVHVPEWEGAEPDMFCHPYCDGDSDCPEDYDCEGGRCVPPEEPGATHLAV